MSRLGIDFEKRFAPLTPEQEQAVQDRLAKAESSQAAAKAAHAERELLANLGRYKSLRLDEYEIYHDDQKVQVDRVRVMGEKIGRLMDQKLNVIFWGTVGTGKDYLATWLLRVAARNGYAVRWLSARDFYDECSAAFSEGMTQKDVYRTWSQPYVLCLSDPVFEDGWNPKNGEYLNRIIRRRYDKGRATWVTCNVRDIDHARELFGLDVWDRLVEQSVLLPCRWESYRTREA